MTDDLTRWSAAELAEAFSRRQISAVEVAQAHLERTAAVDATVRSYVRVDAKGALAQAEAVDEQRAAGQPMAFLAGVPVAVKDVLTTVGLPTTCGSRILAGWNPAVRRDGRRRAARSQPADPWQDQHGRVRDGLLDRALGVRPQP